MCMGGLGVWGGGVCVRSVVQCVCNGREGGGRTGGDNLQEPQAILTQT